MSASLRRVITGMLLLIMLVGATPTGVTYAAEDMAVLNQNEESNVEDETESNVDKQKDEEQSVELESEISEKSDEIQTGIKEIEIKEETESDYSQEEQEEISTDENSIVSDNDTSGNNENLEQISDASIAFVYIESPYLATPDTQRIVFAFTQEISEEEEITISVSDEYGNQSEWPLAKETENLYLFEKDFTGEAYTGVYNVTSINIRTADKEDNLKLSELGIVAEFGVNKEYDGYDELQPLDDESVQQEALDTSVVTIAEDGVAEAQDSIADALNEVSAEINSNSISMYSQSIQTASSSRSGNIIIALDPGHDARSTGASGNGLHEEELTLKIANYCKEELEKYAGVEIYMTRTGADCPFQMNGSGCIEKRVNAAADAGAQIFVSFHLNSSVSSSAKGAEVIIQNDNWRPDVASESRGLAEAILDELLKLGLNDRGIYSKGSENGSTYADGSSSDYYSVHRNCKLRGIPGIIIEHAFISNSNDVNNYLNSEAGLKSLGVADATGIAKYLGLGMGHWETDNAGNKYYYVNNQKVYGEQLIGGKYYHFDEETGVMSEGFCDLGFKVVYYAPGSGEMLYGEQLIEGKYYHFNEQSGAMTTGFCDLGNKVVYYSPETGEMLHGTYTINGIVYDFHPLDGSMPLGFVERDGKTYYYMRTGDILRGEQLINKKYYHFDEETGVMSEGFCDLGFKTVYYAPGSGEMLYGEQLIEGKYYHFNEQSGAMTTGFYDLGNKVVYYSPETGEMLHGTHTIDGVVYDFNSLDGSMPLGFVERDGKTYYYTRTGNILRGEQLLEKKYYHFDEETGVMSEGFCDLGYKTVYYAPGSGEMKYGEQLIDGKYYHFDELSGAMSEGFCDLGYKTVYYAPGSGEMKYGDQLIDGKHYFFDRNSGAVQYGFVKDGTATYYYSEKEGRLSGEQLIDGKYYHFDEKTGVMSEGFCDLGFKTVYYTPGSGEMKYGEQLIDGKYYHFDKLSGAMSEGFCDLGFKTVYYAPGSGEMKYGDQLIDDKHYFFDRNSGAVQYGFVKDGTATYYYNEKEGRLSGEQLIDGKYYHFDEKTGVMSEGFCDLGFKTVYYTPGSGEMKYGEQLIDGKYYHFDELSGAMSEGFCDLGFKTVYYAPGSGEMKYGVQVIEGKQYYFDTLSGAMLRNVFIDNVFYGPDGTADNLHSIIDEPSVSVEQMVDLFESAKNAYPSEVLSKGGASTIEDLARIYCEEAEKENIDPSIPWAQSMLETGWLQFGGQVSVEQFNFAGLGATDGGASGADFSVYGSEGVRMGVRAQIQHLKAYAVSGLKKEDLVETCVDGRFDLVSKGCAPYVEWLGQQENPTGNGWATGAEYGYKIVKIMARM